MSFNLVFDYRFDTFGFFDDPEARAALEAAGEIWEGLIRDEFPDVPAGISFTFANPSTRLTEEVVLDAPIDDLLVFAGARDIPGSTLAQAGAVGSSVVGDLFNIRDDDDFRGTGPVTNYEPWAGQVAFDTGADWSFALDAPVPDRSDFISTALHEIGHILGISRSSPAFEAWVVDGVFLGPNARAVTAGAGVPLESDLSHVEEGFDGDGVLMDPASLRGTRTLPSRVDLAMLADIGYRIDGFVTQGTTPDLVTEGPDVTVFGTVIADLIDGLGGNDQLQGDAGDDTLLGGAGDDTLFGQIGDDVLGGGAGEDFLSGGDGADTLSSGSGEDSAQGGAGADIFEIGPGEGRFIVYDFEPGLDRIRVLGTDFVDPAAAAEAVTAPFLNVWRLSLSDGSRIDIRHDGGARPNAADFEVPERLPGPVDLVRDGTAGPDRLTGGAGNDTLRGGDGADTLVGETGDDRLEGGMSERDRRDVIYGGDGNDVIDGGHGNDELRGDAGDDTMAGGFGADTVIGNDGDDVMTGSAFSDLLFGNDGMDFVNGGFGNDRVNGGAGADRFFHVGVAGHGSDWIQDFSDAEGDTLVWGGGAARRTQFQVNFATTPAGEDDVQEAFVIYRPTGQILWALVDGAGEDSLMLQIGNQIVDILG